MVKGTDERIRQITAATYSARPTDENPAWKNTNHDLRFVLEYLDGIRRTLLFHYYTEFDGEIPDMNKVTERDLVDFFVKKAIGVNGDKRVG
jgi:hypothetical protein